MFFYSDLVTLSVTHALVQFKLDGCSAVAPCSKILNYEQLEDGEDCDVMWTKNKVYAALLIASGNCWVTLLIILKLLKPQI